MGTTLYLIPTIGTGNKHIRDQISDSKRADNLKSHYLLLPSAGVIQDFISELGDTMGVYIFQFYRIGRAIMDDSGLPIQELNDTAIRQLVKHTLSEMNTGGKLTTFDTVWDKPGFIEEMLDWTREMKSQGIFPEDYADFAKGSGTERDAQLAEFYQGYQSFLQERNYSDADGLLWLAAEALEKNPTLFLKDGPLSVLGFDQFTPVQIRILQQLSNRFRELDIYLLWDANRPETSIALTRLHRTRAELINHLTPEIVKLPGDDPESPSISFLKDSIFEQGQKTPLPVKNIQLIEAPSREDEVRRGLRELKRLLLTGISPAKISILAPNPVVYLSIIRTVSQEYSIPVEFDQPLLENPAIYALVNLLEITIDFPWRKTFEVLRSPYIRLSFLTTEQIDLLDQLTRERPVIAGADQWLYALGSLERKIIDTEDEDLGPPPLASELSEDQLAGITEGLQEFFKLLTPPLSATYREYAWWVQTRIIGLFPEAEQSEDEVPEPVPTFDLLGGCRESPYPGRDTQTLSTALRALGRLVSAAEVFPHDRVVSWETFLTEYTSLLQALSIRPDPLQSQVRFGRLEAGRAREADHLFVLGLSEGEFPHLPPPDIFYTSEEREKHPLPIIRYTSADDATLWWQVLGNARKSLSLLRPYIDDNGAPWQPSPFWDAVLECFETVEVERIPISSHPDIDESASINELLVSLSYSIVERLPESLKGIWEYSELSDRIMTAKQSYNKPQDFEGVLHSDSIKSELNNRFGAGHIWSASRLNRYANCPFGFYAEYVLEIEALEEPEEGIDALQRGAILHRVLEILFRKLVETGIELTSDNLDTVHLHLEESCTSVFRTAPHVYGFRPGPLWNYEKQELLRLLRVLINWECEENGIAGRFLPYLQEFGFGFGGESSLPVEINAGESAFRLRGVIDRIDRDSDGHLRLIDYKSGNTKYSASDIQNGLALQTALYAVVAEGLLCGEQERVTESYYLHIPSRATSGKLEFGYQVRENETVEAALQQAAANIQNICEGIFPSAPGKPIQGKLSCRRWCEFASMCRVSRQSISKARQWGLA